MAPPRAMILPLSSSPQKAIGFFCFVLFFPSLEKKKQEKTQIGFKMGALMSPFCEIILFRGPFRAAPSRQTPLSIINWLGGQKEDDDHYHH